MTDEKQDDIINEECKRGNAAATELVRHCLNMGAMMCQIPMIVDSQPWIVQAMPQAYQLTDAKKILESAGYTVNPPNKH